MAINKEQNRKICHTSRVVVYSCELKWLYFMGSNF